MPGFGVVDLFCFGFVLFRIALNMMGCFSPLL